MILLRENRLIIYQELWLGWFFLYWGLLAGIRIGAGFLGGDKLVRILRSFINGWTISLPGLIRGMV